MSEENLYSNQQVTGLAKMDGYENYGAENNMNMTDGIDDFDNVKINLGDVDNQFNNPDMQQTDPSLSGIDGVNIDMDANKNQTEVNSSAPKSMYERLCPCLSWAVIKPYFDVNTHDMKKRMMGSLLPFNQKFYQSYVNKPDLYGPFWILWTLVVILTISGNFSRYLEFDDPKDFTYNFNIVPTAIAILFGSTVGVPIALKFFIAAFGEGATTVPVLHGIGIYAYSFSSFILSSLVCGLLPYDWIQWIMITYSAGTSLLFLSSSYWEDLNKNLTKSKKTIAIAGICACQLTLLFTFKLYFFHHFSAKHEAEKVDAKEKK